MAKFSGSSDPILDDTGRHSLSPREHLVSLLEAYGGMLPAPMPKPYEAAADWWISKMQRPRRDTERTSRTAMGEQDPYLGRLKATLSAFINLPDDQARETIRAGIEDGVEWRGEPMEEYMRIYDETLKMRGMDRAEYVRAARRQAHAFLSTMRNQK